MSLFTRLLPNFLNSTTKIIPKISSPTSNFHLLASKVITRTEEQSPVKAGGLYNQTTRSVIRCHFPRPSERKRVKRHGWKKRMSTPEGRRILMNRILKGCWVYSH